jgi:putative oxidoreductase
MYHSLLLSEMGLTIIRISFGVIFAIFGFNKLMSGPANLTQLGSAVGLFGITWGYLLWGYAAALTELCGGISFALGLYTRLSAIPLTILLIVAIRFLMQNNEPFARWAFPTLCLIIVIAFFVSGSGIYSVDHIIKACSCKKESTPNKHIE